MRLIGASAGSAALAGCTAGDEESTDDALNGTAKIGLLAPSPGSNASGDWMKQGAELAIEELNSQEIGVDFELVVKDTQLDPSTARTKYQELALEEEADMTTGVFSSESAMNLQEPIANHEILHVGSGAIVPEFTEPVSDNYDKYKYIFRAGPVNGLFLGENVLNYSIDMFNQMGWENVGLLVEDIEGFVRQVDVVREGLEDTDISVGIDRTFSIDIEDFTPLYDEFEQAGVDGAFVFMAVSGTTAVNQWYNQERPFGFGGSNTTLAGPTFYESMSGAAQYTWTHASANTTVEITPKTQQFNESYQDEFGELPGYLAHTTYDAVTMYGQAIETSQGTATDDLISTLEEMRFTGTTGDIEFYGEGLEAPKYRHDVMYGMENVILPVFQWQEENGTEVQQTIWPQEWATSEYQRPDWL